MRGNIWVRTSNLRRPLLLLPSRGISAIVLQLMVVRMRHTRSHTANRRSHHALKAPAISTCAHCGAARRPHHMCLECGYYNGRQVMDLEEEKAKRAARIQAKRERISSEANTPASAPASVTEPVSKENTHKEAREENLQDKKPEQKRPE